MKKKIASLLLTLILLLVSVPEYSFANENGKVIFININRTNLETILEIPTLKETLSSKGYISLMNVRGDKITDDKSSYATMGAGGKANAADENYINFKHLNDYTANLFEAATGQKPKGINDLTINRSLKENSTGKYGSTLGSLGQALSDNELKVSVLGNSDTTNDEKLNKNRNIALVAMDENGRIDSGNVDNISIEDGFMPFGIRTDYDKLANETEKYYKESDVLFIELGDTYRLDEYKGNLNDGSYMVMKEKILTYIDSYLKNVFSLINENDTVYITSAFPSKFDYINKKRFSYVIKLEGEGKGILTSATTRREGVVANLDVGVDILNKFGIENENMVGKKYVAIDKDDNIAYLNHEYEKMVSIYEIRSNVVNTFVAIISVSWVLAMLAIIFRKYIPKKEKVFTILKELVKLGIIMPLAFLVSPLFNFKSDSALIMGIVGTTVALYIIGRLLFKDDLKQMGFFALITITLIVIDSINGTYLMQNNIMSYDAMIGARYYGIGNEYEGVTISCAIFALAVLLNYKKMPKLLVVILATIILITSAYPSMGANVGGAISESIAYLIFILLIFDVKLDFKKIILVGVAAGLVVVLFAVLDLVLGTESHLGLFVKQIMVNGPGTIIQTFVRKIQMNLKLAQSSVWVNILLVGILIISIFVFKPAGYFKGLDAKYPYIFKGFTASMVGCIVTLLVNDSGIVAASTASVYILIPLLIMSINMIIFDDKIN